MKKRQQYLEKHPYTIYQGKDGFWHTYLPERDDPNKNRKQVKRKTRRSIEDTIISYWKELSEDPTIADVFREWNDKRLENGAIQASTHDQNICTFKRFCAEFGKRKIKQLRSGDVLDFLEAQPAHCLKTRGKPLTSKAFTNLKVIIRGTLNRARRNGYIDLNVDQIFSDLDVSPKMLKRHDTAEQDDVFTEEELPVFVGYLKEHLDIQNIGLLLMLVTGLRVGELVTLKHSDIEQIDGNYVIHVQRTETRFRDSDGNPQYGVKESPKTTAGIRSVVVPPDCEWLMKKIRGLNPFSEFIFMNDKGERMTTNCFRMRQKRVCKLLGMKEKSPHKSRKTYGSILLNNSCNLNFITNQMGHTDIATTEAYYHKDMLSTKAKSEMLGNIKAFAAV